MKLSAIISSCVLLLACGHSHADWADFGVSTRCIDGDKFTILPIVRLSSDAPGAVDLQSGFSELSEQNKLSCNIGHAKVSGAISVRGARPTGMCGGLGYISIEQLSVNDIPLFDTSYPFNFPCPVRDFLIIKIEVASVEGDPVIEVCEAADWDWSTGYSDVHCTRVSLAADSRLNTTYKQVIAHASEVERAKIRSEQRAWLKMRNPNCRAVGMATNGSRATSTTFLKCVTAETEKRLETLSRNLKSK
ncbi:MAG: DUF1311 domain-containing protein [Burkholderiales bacterium]|nr:DUF1311 domain-containing protein [Burkholderiales bacterium]